MFFVLRDLIPYGKPFKFEYLREFEPEFRIILGFESGVQMGLIHEKPEAKNLVLLHL
jgi:hypothetical protein